MAEPSTPVAELMSRKVKSVPARLDQEQAARMLSQYDFVALPVVSDDGKMVGVITVDDILDIIQEEATEDIQRLGEASPWKALTCTPASGLSSGSGSAGWPSFSLPEP